MITFIYYQIIKIRDCNYKRKKIINLQQEKEYDEKIQELENLLEQKNEELKTSDLIIGKLANKKTELQQYINYKEK